MQKKGYTVDKNAPVINKALYWMDDKKVLFMNYED